MKYQNWLLLKESFAGGPLGLSRPQILGVAGRGVNEKTHPLDDEDDDGGGFGGGDEDSDLDMDKQGGGGDAMLGSDDDMMDVGGGGLDAVGGGFGEIGNGDSDGTSGIHTIDDLIALLQSLKAHGGHLSGLGGGGHHAGPPPALDGDSDDDGGDLPPLGGQDGGDDDNPFAKKGGMPFGGGDDGDDDDDGGNPFSKKGKKPFGGDDGDDEDRFPSDVKDDEEDDDSDDDDGGVPAFLKNKGKEAPVKKEQSDFMRKLTEGYSVPKHRTNTRKEFWESLKGHNHNPNKRYSSGLEEDFLIAARAENPYNYVPRPGDVGYAPQGVIGQWGGQRPSHYMTSEDVMDKGGFKGGAGGTLDLQKNLGPLAKVASDLLAAASDPSVDPAVKAKLMDTLQTIVMGGDPGMAGGDPAMAGGDPGMGGDMGGDPSMGGGDPSMGGQAPGGAPPQGGPQGAPQGGMGGGGMGGGMGGGNSPPAAL